MIKQASINLLRVSGVFDLMRLARSRHTLILTYRRFSSGDERSNGGVTGKEVRPRPKSSPSSWRT
ncbi:MAG: hypothetical protein J2P21_13810 [Chloracidobacterium sp.]|nr:hypothetical protein [Chloracidobacterium sp.]